MSGKPPVYARFSFLNSINIRTNPEQIPKSRKICSGILQFLEGKIKIEILKIGKSLKIIFFEILDLDKSKLLISEFLRIQTFLKILFINLEISRTETKNCSGILASK